MSENFKKEISSDAKQLIEENQNLKQQIEELNNKLTIKNTIYDYESSVFQKAKSISNLAYWSFSFKDYQLVCSEEAYKIFDISPNSIILDYKTVLDFIHPDDKQPFIDEWNKMLPVERFMISNVRIVVPDGSIKYLSIKLLVERDDNNQPSFITGTVTDITDNHFKIETLASSEKLFRSLYHNLTDVFIVFEAVRDNEGTITDYIFKDVNPTYEEKLGRKKEDVINTNLSLQPDLYRQFHPLLMLTIIAGQPQQDRLFIQNLDGFFDVLIYSISENILATIWRDVSLMVEADSSLRESEEKYRQIFSVGSDALFMTEYVTGKIIDVNPSARKMFGFSKNALMKMNFCDLSVSPEKIEKGISEQKSFLLNEICLKEDGSKFPVEMTLSYFNWSGRKVLVASIRDISERINAQENLIRSEQKFKQLFNYSNDAILIIKNYRIIDFNEKSVSLFKIKGDELLNKTLWNLSPGKQSGGDDSRTKAVEYVQNSFLGKQLQFDWIFQKHDGSLFVADIKLSPIIYGNEKVVQAIVRDISHQKESQDALKSKEQRWKLSLEISSIGVWDWNVITNETYFSTGWKAILGYDAGEIPNKFEEFEKRIHPDDIANVYNNIDEYLSAKLDTYSVDFRMRCKNGTYKWLRTHGKVVSYNSNGKPERFIGTHIDITKQKVIEEKLLSEKIEFNIASEISKMGYWEIDLRTMIITGSKQTFEIFGFEGIEQLSMRQLEILIHPEDRKNFISQFISNTASSNNESIFRILINNQTKFIISKSRLVKNSENVLIGYKGIFQDISSLKQEEMTIRNEQNLLKSFTENLQQSFQIIQEDTILFTNEKMTELSGFSSKEINSTIITPFRLAVPEDRIVIKKLIDSAYANQTVSEKLDIRIETKSGRIKWVELSISSFIFKNNITFIYMMSDINERKMHENELITSENWFRSVAASSSSGIAIINSDGNIFYFNNALQQLTGLDTSTLKSKGLFSIFNEKDSLEIHEGIVSMTIKNMEVISREVCLNNNNKNWVLLNIKPFSIQKTKIDFYIITLDNIDFLKNIHEKVESDNIMMNTILENNVEGIALYNKDNTLVKYNSKFTEYTSSAPITTDFINQILLSNNYSSRETQTPDNQFFKIDIKQIEILGEKAIIVNVNDITNVKIIIEDTNNQIEKFRNIFEKSPLGIALIDKNRHVIFSNKQYAQLFGFDLGELLLKKVDELTNPENLGESISKFSQIFTGVIPSFSQIVQMYNKSGEKIWINSNVSQLKDKYGDTSCAIQVVEDTTRLKNEELKTLANERIKTLKFISNSFVNEMFIILNSINRSSYLLKNNINDEKMASLANEIYKSTCYANTISGRLIPFSDKNNKINEIVSVKRLIEDTVTTFNIPENVKINKVAESQNDRIAGDPSLLKQALQNIIKNSLESMAGKGEVSIGINSVYFDSKDSARNNELPKGRYLRITISDTGRGIKQSDLERIFDPFYSTKSSDYNPGIGLTVAQKIINQHMGLIKVFSTVNEGTKFNIYLPQNENDNYDNVILPDEKHVSYGLLKILIIDDEEIIRSISSRLLVDLGYDSYCFSDGKKALQFFKINSRSIDFVLLDSEMAPVDGNDIFKSLKTINPAIRVITMTGFNISQIPDDKNTAEADVIIRKPLSIEKLLAALEGR